MDKMGPDGKRIRECSKCSKNHHEYITLGNIKGDRSCEGEGINHGCRPPDWTEPEPCNECRHKAEPEEWPEMMAREAFSNYKNPPWIVGGLGLGAYPTRPQAQAMADFINNRGKWLELRKAAYRMLQEPVAVGDTRREKESKLDAAIKAILEGEL